MASRIKTVLLGALWLLPVSMPSATVAEEQAIPFSGTDLISGQTVRLDDHRGKVVLVDFWASWCPPCLESLPAYERIYRKLGNESLEIIAINVDENTENGLRFLQDRPVTFPVLADPDGEIGKPYNVRSLPRAFLFDTEGKIVKVYKRFKPDTEQELEQEILALLE